MRLTTLASGSGGNCAVVSAGSTHILLDAGISARRIRAGLAEQRLDIRNISALFITHAHNDHIAGLCVLSRQCALPVFASPETAVILRRTVPECIPRLQELVPGETAEIPGGVFVTPFSTVHDIPGSVGYVINDGKMRFGLCTDLGCVTDEVFEALCGVKAAVIEANHDEEMLRRGPYPYALKQRILSDRGHLSNAVSGALVSELARFGAEQILLGHLSRENNRPELALETVRAMTPASLRLCAAPPLGAATLEPGEDLCLESN